MTMLDVKESGEAIPDWQGVGAGTNAGQAATWDGTAVRHRAGTVQAYGSRELRRQGPSWQRLVVRHLPPDAKLRVT